MTAPATAPVAPTPRRLRRRRWLDLRVIGGLVLVVAAVVVGARVVGASQQTTAVLAAGHDLAAGTVLTDADLTAVEVNLGDSAAAYLDGGSQVAGRTLLQQVRSGELVPAAAVGEPLTGRVLVVPVRAQRMPPGVQHGSVIDLYLSTGDGEDATTDLVASEVTVQSVTAPASGGLSGAGTDSYQVAVLLPAAEADRLVRLLPQGDAVLTLRPAG